MSAKARTFVIIGAGISGLTLALALAKLGAKSVVLERNNTIQEFGAGLQIGPNARRALNYLGLNDEVYRRGFEPDGIDIYSFKDDTPLITLNMGEAAFEHFGVPYSVMHRADLAQMLFQETKKHSEISIKFGVEKFTAEQQDGKLTVTYDSAKKKPKPLHPFALIGADGVGSITRTSILAGPAAEYTGYVAWRALIDLEKCTSILASDRSSLLWGAGFHAVAYPLLHRGLLNVALFTRESASVGFGVRDTPSLPEEISEDVKFSKIQELADDWTHWPLATVKTPQWHKGAIGLIGDAAHSMVPFQAQGAAMGIEDALILAPDLLNSATADAAFTKYENRRQARVARVQKLSASNGEIFHMRTPLSYARDLTVRWRGPNDHFKRLSWLYDYDPTEPETVG